MIEFLLVLAATAIGTLILWPPADDVVRLDGATVRRLKSTDHGTDRGWIEAQP